MAYNYSPEFLVKHRELMVRLINIAKTGETAVFESTTWNAMHNQQYLILNLMANMSRNLVEYADIRQRLRCWTELMPSGMYRLYVGVPQHNLSGRKPGPVVAGWREQFVPKSQVAELVATGGVYTYPDSWEVGEPNFALVGMFAEKLDPKFKRGRFHVPELGRFDLESVLTNLREIFGPNGWNVTGADGEFILMERK